MLNKKVILVWLFIVSSAFANEKNKIEPIDKIESMAIDYVAYAVELCEMQKTEERKSFFAYSLAREVFAYWYLQNYSKAKNSKKLDLMIAAVYVDAKNDLKVGDLLIQAFEDPLELKGYEDTSIACSGNIFSFENYNSYKEEVSKFNKYYRDLTKLFDSE